MAIRNNFPDPIQRQILWLPYNTRWIDRMGSLAHLLSLLVIWWLKGGWGWEDSLVLHVGVFLEVLFISQVLPPVLEDCPRFMVSGNPSLSKGKAGVPSMYWQGPLWLGCMFFLRKHATIYFPFLILSKHRGQKATTTHVSVHVSKINKDDDEYSNEIWLTIQWHYVVCSRMMKVEAHTSCQRIKKKLQKWENIEFTDKSHLVERHLFKSSVVRNGKMLVMMKCLTLSEQIKYFLYLRDTRVLKKKR